MSSIEPRLIRIAVTKGDALPRNRIGGKSNTGTYFIGNIIDYRDTYKFFIDDSGERIVNYFLDISRIQAYCFAFNRLVLKKVIYYDKKHSCDDFANDAQFFFNKSGRIKIDVSTRTNDSRVFLSFQNGNPEIRQLRKLLFANLSYIVFEQVQGKDNEFIVYPDINYDGFNKALAYASEEELKR